MYHNKFTYDANGSMLTAMANNQAGQTIDNQIYHHQTINGRKFSNRTYAITDSATQTSGNDLLDQIAFTDNTDSINGFNNYSYTEIGERKSNKQDSITLITWTVYGKIDSIARIPGSSKYNLKFDYDAGGKRVAKHVYTSNSSWLYSEYYVSDIQGNLLSTYKHQVIDSTSTVSFAQTEKQIYGSSLLGIDVTKMEMIGTLPLSNIFTRPLDNKHYTGSNHLDNVLVTFTDRKLPIDADNNGIIDEFWPDIIASNDYMPFGALLTERTFKKGTFPNSFNGKRDDAEIKSQNYGKREYEPETRELGYTVDPITSQYPMLSPYQFASNTPIQSIDLDGLESFFVPEIVKLGLDILPKVTTDLDIEFIPPATEVTPIPPVTPPYPNAPSAPSEAPPATKTETPATPVTPELPWWAYHADGAENQPKDNTQVPYAPKSEEKKTEDNSNKSEETENEQNKHTEKQNKHVEKQKKQAEKQKREKQIQNQESKKHTKNASKSKGDKHTKKRPGENTGGSRNDKKGNKNKKFIKKINPNKYGN